MVSVVMFLIAQVCVTQINKHVGSCYSEVHVPGYLHFDTEVIDFTSIWCLVEALLELVPKRKHTFEYKYMSEQNDLLHDSSLSHMSPGLVLVPGVTKPFLLPNLTVIL